MAKVEFLGPIGMDPIEDNEKYKCEQLAKLLKSRSDRMKMETYTESFAEFATRDLEFDLIIDATDNSAAREQIDKYAKSCNTPWVYGTVEGFNGFVCLFEKAPFKVFEITDRKPGGITPPMVSFIASLQSNKHLDV